MDYKQMALIKQSLSNLAVRCRVGLVTGLFNFFALLLDIDAEEGFWFGSAHKIQTLERFLD
jgi:hypothetical protein